MAMSEKLNFKYLYSLVNCSTIIGVWIYFLLIELFLLLSLNEYELRMFNARNKNLKITKILIKMAIYTRCEILCQIR